MAKKFVRNITGTTLTGKDKEPLFTNMQNDLLSDDEDVAVRNKKEYHLLTDNLKTHLVKVNAFMSISEKEKNGLKLNVRQASGNEVKNAVDTSRVINPKQAKDMIEQRTPKIVRDIIETDVPQSDWNETDPNSKAFIRNKPDIESGGGGGSVTVPDFSSQSQAETGTNNNTIMTPKSTKQAIDKQVPLIVADQATSIIEKNFEELPQPDWNETNEETHGFIKNKPDFSNIDELVKKVETITVFNSMRIRADNTTDNHVFYVDNYNKKFTDYFSKIIIHQQVSIKDDVEKNTYRTKEISITSNLLDEKINPIYESDYKGDDQIRINIEKEKVVKDNFVYEFFIYDLNNKLVGIKQVTPTMYTRD